MDSALINAMARVKWTAERSNREFKQYKITNEPDGTNILSVSSLTDTELSLNIYQIPGGFIATEHHVSDITVKEKHNKLLFLICEDREPDPDYTAKASEYSMGRRMYVTRFTENIRESGEKFSVCRLGENTFCAIDQRRVSSPSLDEINSNLVVIDYKA